jgi:hypothetical protein
MKQQDIGFEARYFLHYLIGLVGLTDNLDIILLFEEHLQPHAENRAGIHDQKPDFLGGCHLFLLLNPGCFIGDDVNSSSGLGNP